jgi:hypothetical protein
MMFVLDGERLYVIGERVGEPERQRVITPCRPNVKCAQSATVIRSGSVVLTIIAFSRGSVATPTHDSLGWKEPTGDVA